MACLDDTTILRFVTGHLDDLAHRRAEEEVGRCGRCAALVAELVRDRSPDGGTDEHTGGGAGDEPGREASGAGGDAAGPDRSTARYVLGNVIARGGMGTIVAALDRQLDRPVAIKRLDSGRSELAFRFAREIRVTASLQHPGIVPIYDSGLLPDGRPFFAMRHVPGASLEQEIARRRSDRERMALLVPVLAAAEAVAYAHERGVVHRDLKPSNILVGPFGETVVIDWGLARTRSTPEESAALSAGGDPLTTHHGAVLGTPRYMSPEQARGEPASFPSDVHALGAILYHALSGAPPFAATELEAVLAQAARSEVVPLARVAPGLPGDLAAIVERAMAPAPAERYATAGELAADLQRYRTGQLVGAHAYSRRELARRFVRRHRAAVMFAAMSAAVIAVVTASSFHRIVSEREQAEEQRHAAETERSGAEDLVHFLLYDLREKLETVGRLDVLSGVADRVESYYLTTASGRAEVPATLRARAELDDLRAAVANSAGDGAEADRHLQRGMAVIGRAPAAPRTDEVRAALVTSMALRAARRLDLERARALYLQAAKVRRGIHATEPGQRRRNDLEATSLLNRAAVMAERTGAPADAEREWQEAVDILEGYRARDRDDLDVAVRLAEIQMSVGQNRFRRGDLDGAQRPLDLALAAATDLTSREPRNTRFHWLLSWTCLALADLASARGQLDAAMRFGQRARQSAQLVASIEPGSATWQAILGRAEMTIGQFAIARKDWQTAVEHLTAARTVHDALVARDPSNGEHRRAAAVSIAQLAESETALRHTDSARATWLAALSHFAHLAESGQAKARMEWANGLRLYAAFERAAGRSAAADEAIDVAMALVDDTPAMVERPSEISYRAGVLLEAGRAHADHHRQRDARRAWQRGAAMLRARAKEAPLEAESVALLRDIESELAGRAARRSRR